MTDYDKWLEFLRSFGIEPVENVDGVLRTLRIEQGTPRVSGYNMFFTILVFTADGRFEEMGAYE